MSTLSAPLRASELLDPTKVKVVCRDALPGELKPAGASNQGCDGAACRLTVREAMRHQRDGSPMKGSSVASPPTNTPASLALFFSRAPIGVERSALTRLLTSQKSSAVSLRSPPDAPRLQADSEVEGWLPAADAFASRLHVGVYGYRREALSRFVSLRRSNLEELELLEQMRALQAGFKIVVGQVSHSSRGVDTEDDLIAASQHLSRAIGDSMGSRFEQ